MTHAIPFLESARDQGRLCFAEATRAANRAINGFYNARLADAGINIAQFSLLVRLYYRPDTALNRLAKELQTDRTTLSRNLKVLERSGHLRVSPGEDRRQRVANLTRKGRSSLERAIPLWQRAQEDLREVLGGEHWDALFSGLHELARLPGREEHGQADGTGESGPRMKRRAR